MRRSVILFTTAALLVSAPSAFAARLPNLNPVLTTEHDAASRLKEQPASPYAMNYTDEVAQSLGVRGGKADFIDTGKSDDAFVPALKAGVDGGSAMIRLQWHPGE